MTRAPEPGRAGPGACPPDHAEGVVPDAAAPDFGIVAIIALYNGAAFIADSVASIVAQTRPPDEILVVDDGSTDEGPAIVERLRARHPGIRLIRKENGGQSSARNLGVASSRSALIALLDQDDGWYPDHLARLVEPFRAPDAATLGWTYSNLDEVDLGRGLLNRSVLRLIPSSHPKASIEDFLREDAFILPSASLISRAAFSAAGGFDERLSGYEDDDLFVRITGAGFRNVYLDEPLSWWRVYSGSTSFSPRMRRSRMILAHKLIEAFGEARHPGKGYVRDLVAPRFARALVSHYGLALLQGDRTAIEAIRADFDAIAPHLDGRRAASARLTRALMRYPALARLAWKGRNAIRRPMGRAT